MKLSKNKCIEYLERIKKQAERQREMWRVLYDYGIDISNYENPFQTFCEELLSVQLDCTTDDFTWWLYEDVEKKYWLKDGTEIDLSTADKFVKYYYQEA